MTKDKPGATHKGLHWAYYEPGGILEQFDYRKTRGKLKELLKTAPDIFKRIAKRLPTTLKTPAISPFWPVWRIPGASSSMLQKIIPHWRVRHLICFGNCIVSSVRSGKTNLEAEEIKALRQAHSKPVLN